MASESTGALIRPLMAGIKPLVPDELLKSKSEFKYGLEKEMNQVLLNRIAGYKAQNRVLVASKIPAAAPVVEAREIPAAAPIVSFPLLMVLILVSAFVGWFALELIASAVTLGLELHWSTHLIGLLSALGLCGTIMVVMYESIHSRENNEGILHKYSR
ncbi:MAG TPA: hypothetical protein EYO94_13355 [Acidobacteria bacterium]|nr:hypothetical protein [Acidobacteriota bacterium]